MLLHLQFPMADLRRVFGMSPKPNGAPAWPGPDEARQFVRRFGRVVRRLGGGLKGWIGEAQVCNAHEALRIPPQAFDALYATRRPHCAFRRLYSDGRALAKIDIGISTAHSPGVPAADWQTLVSDFLAAEIRVRSPDGSSADAKLRDAGARLAELYLWATSPRGVLPDEPRRAVAPLRPMLFVDAAEGEVPPPANAQRVQIPRIPAFGLWYRRLPVGKTWLPAWHLSRPPEMRADARGRNLRIYLLRLHAEREVFARALQEFGRREDAPPEPRSAVAAFQRDYMLESMRRIASCEDYAATAAGDDEATAFAVSASAEADLRDVVLERAKLLGIKGREHEQLDALTRGHVIYVGNGGRVVMGDQYTNTGVAGAMGPGAQVTGGTFTQNIGPAIDIKALAAELAALAAAMKAQADTPEKEVAAESVEKAAAAAAKSEEPRALAYLKSAGKFALDIATTVGSKVLESYVKKSLGLP